MPSFSAISLRQESEDVFAWLLVIDHDDLAEPIRISSDPTEFYDYDDDGNPIYCTRYNGDVYLTHEAFDFIPPGSTEGSEAPKASFVVSWHPEIMAGIANIHEHLTISGVYINVAEPETPVQVLPKMLLQDVVSLGADISAELGIDHFLDEPAGRLNFDPPRFSALFKNAAVGE